MSETVRVPLEKIAALREAIETVGMIVAPEIPTEVDKDNARLFLAARAVVDAVETEPPPSMYPYED